MSDFQPTMSPLASTIKAGGSPFARIHALCILKNEDDIIEETIASALRWCDNIYVFDNGSTDRTWEIVNSIASRIPQVVAYKQDPVTFDDGLRADIYNAFKDRAVEGDWWCRLDSDEIYIDDPRLFLAKIPSDYAYVNTASFSYYFTERDAANFESDPQLFLATPVEERLRYYVNHWSEPRFVRHRDGMVWERSDNGWPREMWETVPYPVRIWVKHFPYRSPDQIEQRLQSRRGAIDAGTAFEHEAIRDWSGAVAGVRESRDGFAETGIEYADVTWRERIVPASGLCFDSLDRRFEVNEDLMPAMIQPKQQAALRKIAARVKRSAARR